MPGETISVNLFRPWLCAVPRIRPSMTPGFSSIGTEGMQACTISSVRSKSLGTSTPMIAAGTSPKSERTE